MRLTHDMRTVISRTTPLVVAVVIVSATGALCWEGAVSVVGALFIVVVGLQLWAGHRRRRLYASWVLQPHSLPV